jgi:hypothetical protein
MTGNPVYLISTKGSRRVWPVSREQFLLRDIWSCLRICWRSVLPYTRFCNCLLDYDCVLHIVNFAILYLECRLGHYGTNCSKICEYPTYGEGCGGHCSCPRDLCHYETGCLSKGNLIWNNAAKKSWNEEILCIGSLHHMHMKYNHILIVYLFLYSSLWLVNTKNRTQVNSS